MENYNYQSYSKPPRKRGIISYIIVAIIAGIMGGIISVYIAPTYLYGKILPLPEIYKSVQGSNVINEFIINPIDDISPVTAVAKKAIGSVVGITSSYTQRELFWQREIPIAGSGVVVSNNGYILTNSHVIKDGEAKGIKVLFENGDQLDGKLLWNDPVLDLAVVKVNANNIQAADLGNSDNLEVGQLAVAIGNPLGLDFQRSVTSGVISGLHRSIQVDQFNAIEDLIQTDASINPGNSGGPLLNSKGEVIGINTAKINTGEGLGFAIPINLAKPIVEEIINQGKFDNVYVGFKGSEVEVYERQFGVDLKVDKGVVIVEVIPNSPAANADLKPLDIIVRIDNQSVVSRSNLRKILYKYKVGDRATLTINRDGKDIKVDITFVSF